MVRIVCLFCCFCCFCACEKETELEIPDSHEDIATNCLLQANKPFDVYVGKTLHELDTNESYINNAIVCVATCSTKETDTLIYHANGHYKSAREKIWVEGETYSLSINYNNKHAVAMATVPTTVKFDNYSISNTFLGSDGFDTRTITVTFTDAAEIDNYYMLLLSWCSTDTLPFQGYVKNYEWYSYSPVIVSEGDEYTDLFSDVLFNGQTISIPMNFHFWNYNRFYDLKYRVKCYLVTVEKSYYEYCKSLKLSRESEKDIWQTNAVPQIKSNIENGLGIFSGINISDSIIVIL